jgi:hypothetical protein
MTIDELAKGVREKYRDKQIGQFAFRERCNRIAE